MASKWVVIRYFNWICLNFSIIAFSLHIFIYLNCNFEVKSCDLTFASQDPLIKFHCVSKHTLSSLHKWMNKYWNLFIYIDASWNQSKIIKTRYANVPKSLKTRIWTWSSSFILILWHFSFSEVCLNFWPLCLLQK